MNLNTSTYIGQNLDLSHVTSRPNVDAPNKAAAKKPNSHEAVRPDHGSITQKNLNIQQNLDDSKIFKASSIKEARPMIIDHNAQHNRATQLFISVANINTQDPSDKFQLIDTFA